MADEKAPEGATEETSSSKEAIYEQIAEHVQEKTGKRIGKTGGRAIFDMVVNGIFAAATADGSFRLNGGFGSFHVKDYQAGTRRLPSGAETTFGERQKLRYEEGVVVKELVANKGNLEEAIKVRGSRGAKDATAAPATDAKAAAKPTEKPAKPAAEAKAPEPATADAAPAGAEGEVELD